MLTRSLAITVLLPILASLAALESYSQKAPNIASPSWTTAVGLHKEAVQDVSKKGKSLDEPLSPDLQKQFSEKWSSIAQAPGDKTVSYRDAISQTEKVLQTYGETVTVKITAKPGHCDVEYWPIVGGGLHLDAGTTDTETTVIPRYYNFSCDCTSPPIIRKVDTSSNTAVSFACGTPAGKNE